MVKSRFPIIYKITRTKFNASRISKRLNNEGFKTKITKGSGFRGRNYNIIITGKTKK